MKYKQEKFHKECMQILPGKILKSFSTKIIEILRKMYV